MTAATATTPSPAHVRDRPSPATPDGASEVLRRAEGLELVGRFEGSGFKEAPYLVRRSDGQVIQLSRLLYLIAEGTDGRRDLAAIAAHVARRCGRRVSTGNVRFLVDRKLRPLGVLAAADGSTPELAKRPPLLALRHRRPLIGARAVQALGAAFAPLFVPPVVAVVLIALGAVDVWLFWVHGIAQGVRDALYDPTLLLGVLLAAIGATAFHELGHAAACRYGGARPGAIGAGIYLVWPAFYCDVTDAYRLDRAGRIRTDLGGIYFNGIVCLMAAGAYFATHREGVLLLAVVQHMTMLQQLIPLLRFDGYYILSDLTGVPDILSRIGPILRSLLPFRETEPRVHDLKPRVRAAVTLYIAALVPVLALLLTLTIVAAPRVLATAFDSLGLHAARVAAALDRGQWPVGALASLQVAALVLQCAGIGLIIGRTARSTARRLRNWSKGSRVRSVVAAGAGVVAVAALAAVWWPNGDYTPLRPGERGTLPEALSGLGRLPGGEPAAVPATRLVPAATTRASESPLVSGYGVGGKGAPAPQAPSPRPAAPSPPDTGTPVTRPLEPPRHRGGRVEPSPATDTPAPGATAPTAADGSAPSLAPASSPGAPTTPVPSPAPGATSTPSPLPPAGTGDNAAVAANDQDGMLVFALAFDLQRVLGGTLDQKNEALAVASCESCRTIAIAVQVLIATTDVDVLEPVNLALAVNDRCTTCQTLAYAYQLVLTMPSDVQLTDDGRAKLDEIRRALVLLGTSDAPVTTLYAALDSLMGALREVVATQLIPVDATTGTTSDGSSSADGSPTPSGETGASSADGTATPSPDGTAPSPSSDPSTTATPDPSTTATPDPTTTATPDPTAIATPDPTASATPNPTATAIPDPTATTTPDATATATP